MTTDFQHHASEESELVVKILELAGVVINQPILSQVVSNEDLQKIQQEKL